MFMLNRLLLRRLYTAISEASARRDTRRSRRDLRFRDGLNLPRLSSVLSGAEMPFAVRRRLEAIAQEKACQERRFDTHTRDAA
jgi:Zn-dependent oligopeptidase